MESLDRRAWGTGCEIAGERLQVGAGGPWATQRTDSVRLVRDPAGEPPRLDRSARAANIRVPTPWTRPRTTTSTRDGAIAGAAAGPVMPSAGAGPWPGEQRRHRSQALGWRCPRSASAIRSSRARNDAGDPSGKPAPPPSRAPPAARCRGPRDGRRHRRLRPAVATARSRARIAPDRQAAGGQPAVARPVQAGSGPALIPSIRPYLRPRRAADACGPDGGAATRVIRASASRQVAGTSEEARLAASRRARPDGRAGRAAFAPARPGSRTASGARA